MKKKIVSFLAHRSLESRDVIDSKIETLGIMTTFSIAWRIESNHDVDIEYLGQVTMLISSIRVELESWYQFSTRRLVYF
jgi:hypothetical protein